MATTPNEISLSAEQQQQLAALANRADKPWQQVFSEALAAYFPAVKNGNGTTDDGTETESFFDAASRLGLIGCVEGGPADLSTNPKYMEGFGASDS
jgi:hypothetical protein